MDYAISYETPYNARSKTIYMENSRRAVLLLSRPPNTAPGSQKLSPARGGRVRLGESLRVWPRARAGFVPAGRRPVNSILVWLGLLDIVAAIAGGFTGNPTGTGSRSPSWPVRFLSGPRRGRLSGDRGEAGCSTDAT